ncbi:preprotein translocase subunit SecG [Williamsoniiplasma somnilux]|uniref:Protein-export membrane protein SecG n=1 Tax=Williamsoniiplasma somnilux TaxID=215578 RepID=A0A2K8NYY1_9MOLU|nr:preprotein translocase subunit SecG [Williamsoniiplasma somnilux]ATZ19025.1 preprotein translocase subunit SecG [Williamsoniiplasma somnilux]
MTINLLAAATNNGLILAFEIIAFVVSIAMIAVGLIQNKKSQTGLSALNGGNEELFSNSKERGIERILSICMLSFGAVLFIATIIICILTNTIL